ncbi:MAG: HEPN domain-containing protein [Candidatus Heimdallarchaeota archaeon]
MGKKQIIEEAKAYLERSHEALESAKILHKEKRWNDSISRAYYAAFYAVNAALLVSGDTSRSHRGVKTLLGLKIKEGLFTPDLGRAFNSLSQQREAADYSVFTFLNADDATNTIEQAEKIIKRMEQFITSLL